MNEFEAKTAGLVCIDGEWFAPNHPRAIRARAGAVVQKQEDHPVVDRQSGEDSGIHQRPLVDPEGHDQDQVDAVHLGEGVAVDGASENAFRISVTFRFSDKRRRDADGSLSTLFDCLIGSVRRLLDAMPGNPHKVRPGGKGKGRRNDNDRKTVKDNVPF